jgi:hypothetical protein
MTTPYIDPQTVHNPTTGTSPPASWGDTVRDDLQYFSTPPSVKAVRTAVQSISNNTSTAIAFNAADEWDTDSFHSTTTNNSRVTVPTGLGGIYHIIGSASFAADDDSKRVAVLKLNGTTELLYDSRLSQNGGQCNLDMPLLTRLSAGDYLEIFVFQLSGAALNVTGSLSVHWVSL